MPRPLRAAASHPPASPRPAGPRCCSCSGCSRRYLDLPWKAVALVPLALAARETVRSLREMAPCRCPAPGHGVVGDRPGADRLPGRERPADARDVRAVRRPTRTAWPEPTPPWRGRGARTSWTAASATGWGGSTCGAEAAMATWPPWPPVRHRRPRAARPRRPQPRRARRCDAPTHHGRAEQQLAEQGATDRPGVGARRPRAGRRPPRRPPAPPPPPARPRTARRPRPRSRP